jgi:hypothetical protein
MAQADGSKSIMDAINKDAPVLTPEGAMERAKAPGPGDFAETEYGQQPAPVVNRNMSGPPGVKVAPVTTATGMPTKYNLSQYDDYGAAFDGQQPAPVVNRNMSGPPGVKVAPVTTATGMPTDFNISQYDDWGAAYDGSTRGPAGMTRNMTPNVRGGPAPSSGGIGSLVDGAKNLYQGAKDIYGEYFDPSRGAGAGQSAFDSAYDKAMATGRGETYALEMARGAREAATPGIISQYGPLAAAGIGATALMGGFKQPEMPESELQKKLSGTPGADLIEADPSKYVIGNLPGVQYDERGNIIGSTPYSPPQTLDDIRVSAGTGPGQNMLNAYAPPAYSPTAGGGRSILQPYNTSSMYANLMNTPMQPRYAAQGGMMSGGIANLAGGGYPRRTGQIEGPGTEKSDSIPAMLSDGEFVMTAGAVRGAGNGSRRAGAKKMYALMHQLEQNAARG